MLGIVDYLVPQVSSKKKTSAAKQTFLWQKTNSSGNVVRFCCVHVHFGNQLETKTKEDLNSKDLTFNRFLPWFFASDTNWGGRLHREVCLPRRRYACDSCFSCTLYLPGLLKKVQRC